MLHPNRSEGGQRRYSRDSIRRVSVIRVAQQVGLSLEEIRAALASLPANGTPNQKDWPRLSAPWRPRLESQIALLERLRDRLGGCIGCGCLSLGHATSSIPTTGLLPAATGPATCSRASDKEQFTVPRSHLAALPSRVRDAAV